MFAQHSSTNRRTAHSWSPAAATHIIGTLKADHCCLRIALGMSRPSHTRPTRSAKLRMTFFFFENYRNGTITAHAPTAQKTLTPTSSPEPVLPDDLVYLTARSPCTAPVAVPQVSQRMPLTMLHASRELHRRNHATLARSWRIMGTVSARALANPCKNWEVSFGPPASHLCGQDDQPGSSFGVEGEF